MDKIYQLLTLEQQIEFQKGLDKINHKFRLITVTPGTQAARKDDLKFLLGQWLNPIPEFEIILEENGQWRIEM